MGGTGKKGEKGGTSEKSGKRRKSEKTVGGWS
jgi:hypothetical protein